MCGIVGYVGRKPMTNEVLIDGLQALEYRGYDSAGIAVLQQQEICCLKSKGKVSSLSDKMKEHHISSSTLGIAHTRWATHGAPNEQNAHPHQQGSVTLVHNGIIENYQELKKQMLEKGYVFISDTDSEVACACIDDIYQKTHDKLETMMQALSLFKGSFAFGIIFEDDMDTLYAMRRNSPLILAKHKEGNFIVSDIPAILKYTRDYILMGQDEVAIITADEILVYDEHKCEVKYQVQKATMDIQDIQKNGYKHFMLKEIHEEPNIVMDTIHAYLNHDLASLRDHFPDMSKYKELHIVACGSAMYAGMVAKYLIEKKARIPVQVEVASEYRYKHPLFTKETLVILISQSGETADTLAALQLAKQNDIDTFAIVNVVGSSIAREAKFVAYTHAGQEIAVATTKAYAAQVALLSIFALSLAYEKGLISNQEQETFYHDLERFQTILNTMLQDCRYVKPAKIMNHHQHVFFLGRGLDYALSMEGSLKLKEISYIHSEAYPAGELKHGTISLIEEGTPVIALMSDETLFEKTISNIKEVKARGAHVVVIAREDLQVNDDVCDDCILVPKVNVFLQTIVTIIPLQLLAYQIADLRGCEIDQPRNLAKSVTVE